MAIETIYDKHGNRIYLTDERWNHIVEFHEEMLKHKKDLIKTIRLGKRKQIRFNKNISNQ